MNTFVFIFIGLFGLAISSPLFFQEEDAYGDLESPIISEDLEENMIIGGKDASIKDYPFQVSIQYSENGKNYKHTCGGSLLSKQWVLTAARCVRNGHYIVKAGVEKLNGRDRDVQTVKVVQAVVHPEWPGQRGKILPYDIALLKLERPVKYTRRVRKIKLPRAETYPSGKYEVTGWGYHSSKPSLAKRLQRATLPTISLKVCNEAIAKLTGSKDLITEDMVCTEAPRKGESPCTGDNGGPLSKRGVLVGIVSVNPGEPGECGKRNVPSVYINPAKYIDWIKRYVK